MVGGLELPSATSGFRTMEFDGRILVEDAGSGRPRQNISVPSSLWTTQINSPQDLGALDFFERGSVVTFKVQPNHVNNPPAGNVQGDAIFSGAVSPARPRQRWNGLARTSTVRSSTVQFGHDQNCSRVSSGMVKTRLLQV